MEIRPATKHDVLVLARLFSESIRSLGPTAYSPCQVQAWAASANSIEAFGDFLLRPQTFVACDESGPLGFAGLEGDGHVTSVYVRADCLREGIGSRLLTHLIERATQQRIPRLFAEASEFSLPLFLKHEFHKTGIERVERNGEIFKRHLVERRLAFAQTR